jgi:hypothetical protein
VRRFLRLVLLIGSLLIRQDGLAGILGSWLAFLLHADLLFCPGPSDD